MIACALQDLENFTTLRCHPNKLNTVDFMVVAVGTRTLNQNVFTIKIRKLIKY